MLEARLRFVGALGKHVLTQTELSRRVRSGRGTANHLISGWEAVSKRAESVDLSTKAGERDKSMGSIPLNKEVPVGITCILLRQQRKRWGCAYERPVCISLMALPQLSQNSTSVTSNAEKMSLRWLPSAFKSSTAVKDTSRHSSIVLVEVSARECL